MPSRVFDLANSVSAVFDTFAGINLLSFPSLLSSYQFSRNSLILTYQGGNPAMHAGDIQLWHLEATSCKLIKEWDDQRPIRIMRENISTIIPGDPPWFGDS